MEENVATEGLLGEKLAPFNPSSDAVISTAFRMLRLSEEQRGGERKGQPLVLFDLGCGDGRLLVSAVQQFENVRGVGIEYDKKYVLRARERVQELGLQERVLIQHKNVLECDISQADAIFVYLVPKGLQALAPRLKECLRKGVRVVTYVFSLPGAKPVETELYKSTKIYLYTAASIHPDRVAGI